MKMKLRLNHWIDFWKLATLPYLLALQYYTGKDEIRIWMYIALHGAYGILWHMKEYVAPDKQFQVALTRRMAWMSFIYLIIYWIAPTIMMIGNNSSSCRPLEGREMMMWFMIYISGIFLHFGADIQKHYTLANKKCLITDGFFLYLKHPNYIGEFLIYLSFCGISDVSWNYLLLSFQISVGWIPKIHKKEVSLARYPEWDAYSRRCII